MLTWLACLAVLLGMALIMKQLFWPTKSNGVVSPQPLIVALEKEFVLKRDHDKAVKDLTNQVTEARTYAHDRVHDLSETVNDLHVDSKNRNERLAVVENEAKTHTRQLTQIGGQLVEVGRNVDNRVNEVLKAVSTLQGAFDQSQRRQAR
jgi:hypothetical protein